MSEVTAVEGLETFCLLPPALCLKTSSRVDHQKLTRTKTSLLSSGGDS
ncbi:MAG: hypothetical protein PUP92_40505 [Rhizonema sp. PD38]|nr:hypothetical protein [Rhizonema sp. PD38]